MISIKYGMTAQFVNNLPTFLHETHTKLWGNAEESEFLAKKLTYFSGFVLPFYEALPFCAICSCKNPADLQLQRNGDYGKSTE